MTSSVKNLRSPRSTDPIGVFDSGIGGLSTLRYLRRIMPHERFVFLADQSYVPYGEKTARQLKLRCSRVVRYLRNHHVKMIVVACNTATCYALDDMRKRHSIPFIGTVPAVKTACARSKNRSVAVFSTPATARSAMLKDLIRKHAGNCRILRIGCAGLEEAVEHGSIDDDRTRFLVRSYMERARRANVDQLVLGCTHYPFLEPLFYDIYPIPLVDSAPAIARRSSDVLKSLGLSRPAGKQMVAYFTTGDPERFSRVAGGLLGHRVPARKAVI